jgi:hypothetical protein
MRLHVAALIAAAGFIAAPSVANAAMQNGKYECFYFSTPRLTFAFTATGPSTYLDYKGNPGTYTHDTGTERVTFDTGFLSTAMGDGFYAIYQVRNGTPTLAYMSNSSGAEVLFCENA